MNSRPTLVCFAMPEEARPFRRHASAMPEVRMTVTGMGRQNTARIVAPMLAPCPPSQVFTCGLAGALDPALGLNTLLFETQDAALAARLSGCGLRAARFHCADRMVVTAVEKAQLRAATGADAVEMESAAIHELCQRHGIPCATVRVISDVAAEDFPLDFNALTTPEMKLHFGRLAGALLRAPWKVPSLLRLQRQTAAAAGVLAQALVRVLREPRAAEPPATG